MARGMVEIVKDKKDHTSIAPTAVKYDTWFVQKKNTTHKNTKFK